MKDDEIAFLLIMALPHQLYARDLISHWVEIGAMHRKRAWYILQKWSDKGWYDYGVCLDMGWMTEEGLKQADIVKAGILKKLSA